MLMVLRMVSTLHCRLTPDFRKAYEQTLPAIDALEYVLPDGANAEAHIEACMQVLRNGLTSMEQCTTNMMNMLYEVDVYMAPSTVQNAAGFNPQEALSHVSDLFHVRVYTCTYSVHRAISPSCYQSERHLLTILART